MHRRDEQQPSPSSVASSKFQTKLANLLRKEAQQPKPTNCGGARMFQQETTTTTKTTKAKIVLAAAGGRDLSPRMAMATTASSTLIRENNISPVAANTPPRPLDPAEPSTSSLTPTSSALISRMPAASSSATRSPLFDLPIGGPASPFLGPSSSSSPVPSPQWRPSSGSGAGGGSGRAMPKSALLMSKCQAFLKSGNVDPTPIASDKSSGEANARIIPIINSDQQLPTDSKGICKNEMEKPTMEIVKANGTSPEAECIFNFEDVFFEEEADEVNEGDGMEEELNWREVGSDFEGRGVDTDGKNAGKTEEEERKNEDEKIEGREDEFATKKDMEEDGIIQGNEEKNDEKNLAEDHQIEEEREEIKLKMEDMQILEENMGENGEGGMNDEEEEINELLPNSEINVDLEFAQIEGNEMVQIEIPHKNSANSILQIVQGIMGQNGGKEKDEENKQKIGPEMDGDCGKGVAAYQQMDEEGKSATNRRIEEEFNEEMMGPNECLERRQTMKEGEEKEKPNDENDYEEKNAEIGLKDGEETMNLLIIENEGQKGSTPTAEKQELLGGIEEIKLDKFEMAPKNKEKQKGETKMATTKVDGMERPRKGSATSHSAAGKRTAITGNNVKKRRAGTAPPPLPSLISGTNPTDGIVPSTSAANSSTCSLLSCSSLLPSGCSSSFNSPGPSTVPAGAAELVIGAIGTETVNSASSPPPASSSSASSRVIERLGMGGMQLRNLQLRNGQNGAKLVVGIRLDGIEVFRTNAVQLSGNSCVIGEEFSMGEVPRHFHTLQLNLFELVDGGRQQRLLGKVKLSRREMLDIGDPLQERWLPILRVRPVDLSELLGSLCVEIVWDQQTKMLTLKVLDLTTWNLSGGRENPLDRYCRESGRLQLKLCVAFGRSAFTSMQKMRLSERRGLEQVHFDCSSFFPSQCSTAPFPVDKMPPHPNSPRTATEFSTAEWLSGLSACSSPACTPSWAPQSKGGSHHSRRNSRQFHFPPPSPGPLGVGQSAGRMSRQSTNTKNVAGYQGGIGIGGMAQIGTREEPRVHIKLYGQTTNGNNATGGNSNGTQQDSFCGSVRIGLDPERMQPRELANGPNWFNIRSGTTKSNNMNIGQQHCAENLGEVRLKFWYNQDEVLPLAHYQPLYTNLTHSLNFTPYSHSLIPLIQCLQLDIENLAQPLMKIFIHSNQIRHFFRLICLEYVSNCSDVNTLFRSQSLASKVMYEMMKFTGQKYLIATLRPLIDLIYAERKSCEIDPSKLKPGETLEHNFRTITVYAELAFSRVVDSRHRCPQVLREIFAELRSVVEKCFPGRDDVARLALSSFLIMRFFAAAILNPKLFALKLDTPDIDVSRTLVLVSKILQRLANCVVSAHPLTTKEQWLAPVLHRFSDESHKMAMINFLDEISAPIKSAENRSLSRFQPPNEDDHGLLVNNENALPSTPTSPPFSPFGEPQVLKSGYLIERRFGPVKKRSFKNFIHPKRRLVVLTESILNWQKTNSKDSSSSTSSLANALNNATSVDRQHFSFGNSITSSGGGGGDQPKNQIPLAEVTSVSAIVDAKNSFRVATVNTEVHFQAGNEADMNEWIILIQKQQRRHLMHQNRPIDYPTTQMSTVQQAAAEVDIERELHAVYTQLADHFDTLCKYGWCCRLECSNCGNGGNGKANQTEQEMMEGKNVPAPIILQTSNKTNNNNNINVSSPPPPMFSAESSVPLHQHRHRK